MSKKMDALMKLLTPELRKEVADRQEECYRLAEKHFNRKFERPEVRFDIKNHDGGRAYSGLNLIRYNLILLVENKEHFLKQTVAHEVAHLINRAANKVPEGKKRLMPHGKEWKAIMTNVFHLEPHVTHTYDCSSIEKAPKRKRSSKHRVENALRVIDAVLRRASTKFTPEEQAKFAAGLEMLGVEYTFEDAA